MPCPTCSETMQVVTEDATRRVRWCPRCGTLTTAYLTFSHVDQEAPKLVERCRRFEQRIPLVAPADGRPWHTLGIAEAINLPENRPQV